MVQLHRTVTKSLGRISLYEYTAHLIAQRMLALIQTGIIAIKAMVHKSSSKLPY